MADEATNALGEQMHLWAQDLFPICRSLTGDGVRDTLRYLSKLLPGLEIKEVPSGSKVLDWTIPNEWNPREAWIADETGKRIIDFSENNLHLVGYSEPADLILLREELDAHLYSLPDQPNAIPYVTSYYSRGWGFCVSEQQRAEIGAGPFHIYIDAELGPGSLTYAELVIPGESNEEILLSTYVCHPSMANNELSGPVVTTALAQWIASLKERKYTYRIVFVPETIGSITYIALNQEILRRNTKAGWVVTCIGDNRKYSYVPSRMGNTTADKVSRQILSELPMGFDEYSFLDRGSDERQWCAPGIDLPVCSVMRSKYGTYPEYHTSLDDLSFVTPTGLAGGFDALRRCLTLMEKNRFWRAVHIGEPQLGPRGLYPTTSYKGSADHVKTMMDVLAYCDGNHDVVDLCQRVGATSDVVVGILEKLAKADLIQENSTN
jgi:aminopeptidase-like protein